MTKLPRISGRECVSALLKLGFHIKRQHGSHIILRRESPFAQAVVPDHSELDTGTLRFVLRQAGISPEEFISLI
jgi:predicted RNA binding protein YcfA (HicA-like mRNA interferase family)